MVVLLKLQEEFSISLSESNEYRWFRWETVDLLRKEGLIENYADLYNLTSEQVIPLERMAEKSAKNMIEGINKSKEIPFEKVYLL